jgi:hypothetical protein
MNELDYVRDNRLRLWFIDRGLPAPNDIRKRDRENLFRRLITDTFQRIVPWLRPGGHIVLVVGDSRRGRHRTDAASLAADVLMTPGFSNLTPVAAYRDQIPDIRRTRRDLSGTKTETILVFSKRTLPRPQRLGLV